LQLSISTLCSIKIIDDNIGRGITSISVDATKNVGKKFDQAMLQIFDPSLHCERIVTKTGNVANTSIAIRSNVSNKCPGTEMITYGLGFSHLFMEEKSWKGRGR